LIAAKAQAKKRPTAISWRMDETYIKVRGKWIVARQPPCPRATTILAGFQAAEVGVSFNVSG